MMLENSDASMEPTGSEPTGGEPAAGEQVGGEPADGGEPVPSTPSSDSQVSWDVGTGEAAEKSFCDDALTAMKGPFAEFCLEEMSEASLMSNLLEARLAIGMLSC